MTDERRNELRADVEIEVQYRTGQEFLAAYTRNMSGGGVFIRTATPLPLNQALTLRFTLPGIAKKFEVGGLVVWVNTSTRSAFPAGMGIKFLNIDPADANRVTEFVKNIAGEHGQKEKDHPEKEKK